jgi:PAB1-binding protein PBP1
MEREKWTQKSSQTERDRLMGIDSETDEWTRTEEIDKGGQTYRHKDQKSCLRHKLIKRELDFVLVFDGA